ncbi:cytochrome P450 [Streptomyces lavenduligriseus]|uniref:Cytochrome P450 n=1 Tax=Streptomyces lavenduligriseus TaxID=67315 RepID=A0ABT0NKZ0_9ACTN|nr:cytochrome P450 [Streptomyces lavenduligriseus]MCL3992129.1 cytochrome P450 [Streptomyces lavenduligriseus]
MAPAEPTTTTRTCAARTDCPAVTPGAITAHGAGEPGPLYAHLRRDHPVFHDPALDAWVVSRHTDIDTVLRDADGTFSTALGYLPLQRLCPQAQAELERSAAVPVLSSLDPPHHARFRRQMTAVFPSTDRRVHDVDGLLRDAARHAAERFAARAGHTGDLVDDWARPLATAALGHLAGIPPEDQPALIGRAAALTPLVWGHLDDTGQTSAARALNDLFAYCHALTGQRARTLGDDLVSGWLRHQDADGQRFTTREVASTLMEVLITNAEITPRLLVNILYRLLETGTWQRAHHARWLPDAIEETLRHDPPLTGWLRNTTREVRLSGVRVPAGARLLLLLASAARDEDHPVTAPDTYDPARTDAPPLLAFGAGIHYCPGAPYTRRLAHHALTALADLCPGLALADPHQAHPDTWPLNAALRSPAHLMTTW